MNLLLGIDIGTSGTKACLFDPQGKLVNSAFHAYNMQQPHPGWAEQDPHVWWEATQQSVQSLLRASDDGASNIRAVGLSGQMHSLVLLDKNDRVLRPSILWCDQRTDEQVAWVESHIGKEKVIEYTSNPPLTNFTAIKLLWVKQHEPEIYKQINKILLPKDYIRYQLTGSFATEVSDASGTLLLDVENRKWSSKMLEALGIDQSWIPELYESYEVSDEISANGSKYTGLMKGTPVVGGAGDQAAGAVGNGIVEKGLVSTVLGTSGVVFAHADEVKTDPKGRLHTFCHAVPDKWHLMGVTQAAAGSFQWFRNEFGQLEKELAQLLDEDAYDYLTKQAKQITPGSEGLMFLPYLMGERTPHLDSKAKGAFIGFTIRHRKAHFTRSVMEGVSYSLADNLHIIKQLGVPVSRIRLSGGGAKSDLWCQMLTDIFGESTQTIEANEGPAFGAALLAGVGSDLYASVEEAVQKTSRVGQEFKPNAMASKKYEQYYEVFRQLYGQIQASYHALHEIAENEG